MRNTFTVHCVPWEACAPILNDVRVAASQMRVISHLDAMADDLDQQVRHAIALSQTGQAIGCARITLDGRVERIAVLPHVHQSQVKAAMIEILKDFAQQGENTH